MAEAAGNLRNSQTRIREGPKHGSKVSYGSGRPVGNVLEQGRRSQGHRLFGNDDNHSRALLDFDAILRLDAAMTLLKRRFCFRRRINLDPGSPRAEDASVVGSQVEAGHPEGAVRNPPALFPAARRRLFEALACGYQGPPVRIMKREVKARRRLQVKVRIPTAVGSHVQHAVTDIGNDVPPVGEIQSECFAGGMRRGQDSHNPVVAPFRLPQFLERRALKKGHIFDACRRDL